MDAEPSAVWCSAVVATVGRSRLLERCLQALRDDGGSELEIVLVHQGDDELELSAGLADRVLRVDRNLGFAAAVNLGLVACQTPFVATVNDDAVIEPGWLAGARAALDSDPLAAAAQGTNVRHAAPDRLDGCGLAWNRSWQAVQIGHGAIGSEVSEVEPGGAPRERFGVSATAALFRRSALLAASPGGAPFDTGLISYYEDVDLACRLRGMGLRALHVPAVRVRHAGSTTGNELGRLRLVYGNRYLVLARLLGRSFLPRLPLFLLRDTVDLGACLAGARFAVAGQVLLGWGRALRRLPSYVRFGPPLVPLAEIRRLRTDRVTTARSS